MIMNKKTALAASALLIGATAFSSVFADDAAITVTSGGAEVQMGQMGPMPMGMMQGEMRAMPMQGGVQADPFSDPAVKKALTDAGIAVPTSEEAKAFMEKQMNAFTAEAKLSETDKAGLKALRESFRKQEREYLRSKGVDLPTEDTYAKFDKIHEVLKQQMKSKVEQVQGTLQEVKALRQGTQEVKQNLRQKIQDAKDNRKNMKKQMKPGMRPAAPQGTSSGTTN
jgi:hypothetical protein